MVVVPITNDTPEMLKQADAARLLGVSDRTVRNYIRRGYISATPTGKVITRSIIQFLEEEEEYA